mmetsp:Transcript_32017/g.73570  ORF Transcript_32017/g.73570 Transcript_32017/m.73570 type:complete len:142 (+) Transcript_32017:700-1125(+)
MKKKINSTIKNKIYNNLMKNGNKNRCEIILIQTLKNLQKNYKKNHLNIIKLALINAAPIAKLKTIKRKKRKTVKYLPYILNEKNRISIAIKNIILTFEKNNSTYYELKKEFILNAKNESKTLQKKITTHEQALAKKKIRIF